MTHLCSLMTCSMCTEEKSMANELENVEEMNRRGELDCNIVSVGLDLFIYSLNVNFLIKSHLYWLFESTFSQVFNIQYLPLFFSHIIFDSVWKNNIQSLITLWYKSNNIKIFFNCCDILQMLQYFSNICYSSGIFQFTPSTIILG